MAKRLVIVEVRSNSQQSKEGVFRGPEILSVPGFTQDLTYTPEPGKPSDPQRLGEDESVIFIRGEVDELFLSQLREHPLVLAVWDDGPIEPTEITHNYPSELVDCDPDSPKGDLAEVAKYLKCDWIWNQGYRGAGIVIAICDTGIDSTKAPVLNGWTPKGELPVGTDNDGHGSMCATDVLGIAPEAQLYDIGILKGKNLLSDVLKGYGWILDNFKDTGQPQIVSNSWALYRSSYAPEYAYSVQHPVTRRIIEAIDVGICVVFAAGNCGSGGCTDGRCGNDNGPGRSIWGVNGHPKVMTVGAANITGQWIGYSSQGPASLCEEKPDICAPSHYSGYNVSDSGTSAACPLCAGVIALIRQAYPSVSFGQIKQTIKQTTRQLYGQDWNAFTGHGMIDAKAAFEAISTL